MATSARLVCGAALALFLPLAQAADYDEFVGDFAAMFIPPGTEKGNVSDLGVSIREIDGGLNISWDTTTLEDSAPVQMHFSIDFLETERKNIFKAAQRKNLFGGRDPLDPMKGEPYAWARIVGKTLSVYVMLISDEGGYEIQTYDRTLMDNGDLATQFSRIRNGELVRTLKATLSRHGAAKPEKNR